ncbi:MAG: InlB B-repeat-containing protein, partial [Firmicutes bacterium]|nr:InlB B-repeat-containing protein [Bacillota bacterium]
KLENGCKIVTPEWSAENAGTIFTGDILEEKDGVVPAKKVVITKYYDASVDDSVQNGTITIEPEGKVSEGDEVTVTVTPKPGYKVEKITVTDSQGNEIPVKDGKFIMPAGNVTVSATFKKDGGGASSGGGRSGSVSFILTYETNGGSEIKAESHATGDNVTLDKTPTKDGYTFTGWYADKECTQKIESITMNSSKTVYAGWDDGTQPVKPDENAPLMVIRIGDTKYQLNGVDMEMDSAPFIDENDRTMLPVRVVANALGISDDDIAWDNETKTASFTRPDGKVVSCTVGSNIIKIGDEEIEIDTAPVIRNDRIYLPMRALFNAFNVSDVHIIWNGVTKTVTVTKEALDDIKALAEESPSED